MPPEINKKTLLYYDEIGLFHPACVKENGYRFYSLFQLDRLSLIITLRDMGVSLKDIREYLEERNVSALNEILLQKQAEIDTMVGKLVRQRIT